MYIPMLWVYLLRLEVTQGSHAKVFLCDLKSYLILRKNAEKVAERDLHIISLHIDIIEQNMLDKFLLLHI